MSSIDLGWAVNWKIPLWRRHGGGANAWKREMTTLLPPLVPPYSPSPPSKWFQESEYITTSNFKGAPTALVALFKAVLSFGSFLRLVLSVIQSFPFGSPRSLIVRENRLKTFSSRVALELRGTREVFQGLAGNDSAKKLTDFHEIFSTHTNKDHWAESKMKIFWFFSYRCKSREISGPPSLQGVHGWFARTYGVWSFQPDFLFICFAKFVLGLSLHFFFGIILGHLYFRWNSWCNKEIGYIDRRTDYISWQINMIISWHTCFSDITNLEFGQFLP